MIPFESFSTDFLFAFHSNNGRLFSRFDTIHERDRQTDSQPPHDSIGRAMYRIALQKGPLNDGPSLCCPSPGLLQRAVLRRHRRTDALPAVSSERCRTAHRVQDCDSRPPALVRQRPGLPGLSPTPVSDNRVLPTLEHSLSVGRATFLELDICRSRTTSLEQLPPNLTTMWAVIRPVHAVTEDSNIRTVRPRRSVNCF